MTPHDDGSFEFSFNIVPEQAKSTLKETFDYIASHKKKIIIAVDEGFPLKNFTSSTFDISDNF